MDTAPEDHAALLEGGARPPRRNRTDRTGTRTGARNGARRNGARNGARNGDRDGDRKNGRGKDNDKAGRRGRSKVTPGFIDLRLSAKSEGDQYNHVLTIANWYMYLLDAVNWGLVKTLSDYMQKTRIYVPPEIETVVRDLHASHARIVRYYQSAHAEANRLAIRLDKNQLGALTDNEGHPIALTDDPTATTQLFFEGRLMVGSIMLSGRMASPPDLRAMRDMVKGMCGDGKAIPRKAKSVPTRVDYDPLSSLFFAHFAAAPDDASDEDYIATAAFRIDPTAGVMETKKVYSYEAFIELTGGRLKTIVVASSHDVKRLFRVLSSRVSRDPVGIAMPPLLGVGGGTKKVARARGAVTTPKRTPKGAATQAVTAGNPRP